MSKRPRWTQQQQWAIKHRGSDVIVTASAGTGKTSVLSGRCVEILSEPAVCGDVRRMLVVTFTNAAADEMRSRIAARLKDEFLRTRNPHLRKQLLLLDAADISTIHSFCQRLISEYFYELGIDPAFRIIEGDEQRLLKAEILEETVEWAWDQSNLRAGLTKLLKGRGIYGKASFLEKIIKLNDFLDGVVSRRAWFERAISLAEATEPMRTDIARKQQQIVLKKLQECKARLGYAQKLDQKLWKGGHWTGQIQEDCLRPVREFIELCQAGKFEACAEGISNFVKPKFRNRPRGMSDEIRDTIKAPAQEALEKIAELGGFAVLNPDYVRLVGRQAGLQTKILVELVKEFGRHYGQAKREMRCLDFADLEHYALELLSSEDSQGRAGPSDVALQLRDRYKVILVDEYQDINPVQKAILDRLSRGRNLFVVGDVKQSIYAWRQGRPKIFADMLESASADPADCARGLRVDLNENFRSRQGVLAFVNKVFGRIMTAGFASIDYDEKAALKAGAEYKPLPEVSSAGAGECAVEMHILDEEPAEPENQKTATPISAVQRQAGLIAQRIKQMVADGAGQAEFKIYDKQSETYRPVRYRDIVILMRSLVGKVNVYTEVLSLAGIPVHSQSGAGYFAATEVTDCLSLLKVLDNPQRDIELAAVLRSWFFKLSDTELAKIRAFGNSRAEEEHKLNFYQCVRQYCQAGPEENLRGKVTDALAKIARWRTLARQDSLAELIWRIYRETNYLSFVGALPSGRRRRANLLKLHDRAIQFESFATAQKGGLSRFVEFVEKLIEQGGDYGPADVMGPKEDAVRIMSIHKSKGLEFGVVFLAELNGPFNKSDSRDDCLADAADTVGIQIIEPQSNAKLASLEHQVIAEQKEAARLAEEQRVLYVAMTRARERLILTGSAKKRHGQSILYEGCLLAEAKVADWQLRRCTCPLEWLLYALADAKKLHDVFETGSADGLVDEGLFGAHLCGRDEQQRMSEYILDLKNNKLKKRMINTKHGISKQQTRDSRCVSKLKASLERRYRFEKSTQTHAKSSVSELTHQADEFAGFDYSRALQRAPRAVLDEQADFIEQIDRRLIGTATHIVLGELPICEGISKEIDKTIRKLVSEGAILGPVTERINAGSIKAFFESELGKTAVDPANRLRREWPFTFAVAASEIDQDVGEISEEESVIVQGIIDMVVETPEGLVIIDFKTDNVNTVEATKRAESYKKQINLYGRAAEAILKAPIIGKWLYFLTPGCAIEV